jgi:predicted enzyme related to lactoylglutathione lyase
MTNILRPCRALAALVLLVGVGACSTTNESAVDMPLSEQPLVGKFVWHDLITDDVASVRRFYGELLGWEFEKTVHPLTGDYTLITSGGQYVGGIVQLDDAGTDDYSRWLPYLSVADVDAAVGVTVSAGGEAVVEPLDLGSIGRAAAVTDPQGAVLGLLRSRVGDPDDSAPVPPGGVVWNELLAADDAGAAGFYRAVAGLEVRTISRRGGEYTLLRAQGRERAGILKRPDDRVTPQWLTHFAVTDVAMAARRAAELGGEVLLTPSPELREGTLAVVTDPAGAVFALQQWPH